MSKERILYYIKLSLTIIISIMPLIATCWWLWDKYAHVVNWEPVINGLIIIGVLITTVGGLVLFCIGISTLYKQIKVDLRDKELKKEGYTICRRCEGRGCSKCNQKGYLDWVQRVVGAKDEEVSAWGR